MERIDASPTKEFFIDMLTRDITLVRAIIDLVDNSVDAANVLGDLPARSIKISIDNKKFRIEDNCGGIDHDTALHYAFRFGRSSKAPLTPNSVGQFGVGMKRTLFKIGNVFSVLSRGPDSSFKVNVDVAQWLSQDGEWGFNLETLPNESDVYGTEIEVSELRDTVSEQFELNNFIQELIKEIGKAHFKAINNGLNIVVNGTDVPSSELLIRESGSLGAVGSIDNIMDVQVTIIAGISERELRDGGWYVVCNGRLVEEADQSKVTGWGEDQIPKYHPDFAFFRGIVDFECEDSSKLPWTTTKTGVDVDNKVYRAALSKMKSHMRKIIILLRERAKEDKDFDDDRISNTPINDAIEDSSLINIYEAKHSLVMKKPEAAVRSEKNKQVNIVYKVPASKLDEVKEVLSVNSAKEVGELTFEYYYEYECGDE